MKNSTLNKTPHDDQIEQLLSAFNRELDIEYNALKDAEISLLMTSKARQGEIQKKLDRLVETGHGLQAYKRLLHLMEEKISRNLTMSKRLHKQLRRELRELGNFRRVRRQLFPQKNENNTPVLIDIRR
ncbi:MAG: hypothetical protein Q9P90_00425 [candidate division KSB1 bacterium]|nr:hypothetical protein [candidate division KSB1 bacterium]